MIHGISAITLATHDMAASVKFYNTLNFPLLYGGPTASFTSYRAGPGYRNLIAHPEVSLQDGATVHRLRAREAEGEEKARWWTGAESFWPHFPEYRAKAGGRDIPVMLLEPIETPSDQTHLLQDGER